MVLSFIRLQCSIQVYEVHQEYEDRQVLEM